LARLGQGPVGDMAQQASVTALTTLGKEAVDLALHAATAETAKGGPQRRQGKLARTGEGGGETGWRAEAAKAGL
jgi:hypothetical protein